MKKLNAQFLKFLKNRPIMLLISIALAGGITKATTVVDYSTDNKWLPPVVINVYPNAITSFSGGGTICNGSTIPSMTVTFNTAQCNNWSRTTNYTNYVNVTVTWYDNGSTNSTSGGTVVNTQTGNASQTSWTYTPSSIIGPHYYYCVITWSGFAGVNNQCTSAVSAGAAGITSSNTILIKVEQMSVAVPNPSHETATATPALGTSPYTYLWSNGETTQTLSNVTQGTYTVVVTDAIGCSASVSALVDEYTDSVYVPNSATLSSNSICGSPNKIELDLNLTTSICVSSGSDGATLPFSNYVTVNFYSNTVNSTSGGTLINTQSGYSVTQFYAYQFTAPGSGMYYYATITYLNSPTATTCNSFTLTTATVYGVYNPLVVTTTYNGSPVCTAVAAAVGGYQSYSYNWVPGNLSGSTIPVSQGSYTVTVTDGHGCSATASVNVTDCAGGQNGRYSSGTSNTSANDNQEISIYPNPGSGQYFVKGINCGMLLEIYDYTGKKVNALSANDNTTQVDISTQANGVYLLRILSKEGKVVSEQKLIKTN